MQEQKKWIAGVRTSQYVHSYACYPGSQDDESVVDKNKIPDYTTSFAAMAFRFKDKSLAEQIAFNMYRRIGRGEPILLDVENAFGPKWTQVEVVII